MTIEVLLMLILVVLSLTAGVLIAALWEMRSASIKLRQLVEGMDENLQPALDELNETLKNTKEAADVINDVSKDVRRITSSTRIVGEDLEAVSSIIHEIPPKASALWAGIQAGLRVLTVRRAKK